MGDNNTPKFGLKPIHWLRVNNRTIIGIRFGRGWRLFSERYQGTRGIPVRFIYLFGGLVTFVRPRPTALPLPDRSTKQ